MNYARVIPRDLFNEAKLLKCLGQLALIIHDGIPAVGLQLCHEGEYSPGFEIVQDPSDAALYCANLHLFCRGEQIVLRSPYNSKDAYPLRFSICDSEGVLFDESGKLSCEFISAIKSL